MKVKELIEQLSQQDQEKEVIITEELGNEKDRYKIDVVDHILGKVVLIFYVCEDDRDS